MEDERPNEAVPRCGVPRALHAAVPMGDVSMTAHPEEERPSDFDIETLRMFWGPFRNQHPETWHHAALVGTAERACNEDIPALLAALDRTEARVKELELERQADRELLRQSNDVLAYDRTLIEELERERDKLRRSWEQLLEDAENPQARAHLSLNEILSRGRAALSSSDSGEPGIAEEAGYFIDHSGEPTE